MHTIESSVLVPLGLGLIVILLTLTFYLHDQVVLTAEYSSTILEWQMQPGKWTDAACEEEAEQWDEWLLITQVSVLQMKAGDAWFALRTREEYRLFDSALRMLEQRIAEEYELPTKRMIKIDPCWLKRIWKVVEVT
ncbi:MAG: hypothetical protein IJZ85_13130 [Lachnospiraceae bacterium]|nr:hypothetical protein [Lachnospiraceae bacterium]